MFCIAMAASSRGGAGAGAPLIIGFALLCCVYLGGHLSGAHYNPAVTLSIFLRGKMESSEVAPYWIAQFLGSLAAFAMGWWISGGTVAIAPGPEVGAFKAVVVEILFTFMLALVVLNVATHPKTAGNSYYGLAIGFTIVVAAYVGGGISGGAFNPAVGFGATVINAIWGGGSWGNLWIYIVGPLVGGALAAFAYTALSGPDGEPA